MSTPPPARAPVVADLELADQLRGVIAAMATRRLAPEAMAEAAELVGRARALLDGPARDRWSEGGEAYRRFSPFQGEASPLAPPMEVERRVDHDGEPVVVARAELSAVYEGPPGGVHGGILAGMFDEILGGLQSFLEGPVAVTASLTVRYRRITPLHTPLELTARIGEHRGRRILTTGECWAAGERTATAEGLFVRLGES